MRTKLWKCGLGENILYTLYRPFREIRAALVWVGLFIIQQPQEQRYPAVQVDAGSVPVSVMHRTLAWTTGSLACVRDHSFACVCTRGLLGHTTPTTSQHNIFDSEKIAQFDTVVVAVHSKSLEI